MFIPMLSNKPAPVKTRSRISAAPKDAESTESAVRVLRQFRVVFNSVRSHFQRVEKEAGVGGAQLWALSLVGASPDIGVGDLAHGMDIHQSTASNLVRALIERELLSARKRVDDRRAVQLRVTAAGARVLRRAPGPLTGVLPQALASLDSRTLGRLDSSLGALITALGADARAKRIPLGD
ncbi:MAG: MarR family winged helix-turn-helix transcriptional regulator [Caldimonas sp.]